MKKIFALVLVMVMAISFSACKKSEDVSNKPDGEEFVTNKNNNENDDKADNAESEKNNGEKDSVDEEDKIDEEDSVVEEDKIETDNNEETKKEDIDKTENSENKKDEIDKDTSSDKKPESNDKKPGSTVINPDVTDKKPETNEKPPVSSDKKPEINTNQGQANENSNKSLGNKLLGEFMSVADSGNAISVAEKVSAYSELSVLPMGTMPVTPGLLTGFENFEITGFKEGAMFAPMMGTIPFVGYIFTLEDGKNASEFISKLKSSANRRWNLCTEAEETVVGNSGNKVFFVMCNKSLAE